MSKQSLATHFSVRRRYLRSVNLERDIRNPHAVEGYVLTQRSFDAISRILSPLSEEQGNRAWTVTGPYGSGKSAFAQFLVSLLGEKSDNCTKAAKETINKYKDQSLLKIVSSAQKKDGYVCAVATASREPVSHTVLKALLRGSEDYWVNSDRRRNPVMKKLEDLQKQLENDEQIESKDVLYLVKKVAAASGTGLLLVIDELGKNLEYCSSKNSEDDIYLLQQIAELSAKQSKEKILLLGLLHQTFSDYANTLTIKQKKEWAKIQGRFEDIPFAGSPGELISIIGQAIEPPAKKTLQKEIQVKSKLWFDELNKNDYSFFESVDSLKRVCPLHPVTAHILPLLCRKYAQNDRTLFTFLTSKEPSSFAVFLEQEQVNGGAPPTLKLHRLYDYFVEAAGAGIYSRPQYQRWVEVQSRISEAKNLKPFAINVLKTIGILNLASSSGQMRATKDLVTLAMCEDPKNKKEISNCKKQIDYLISNKLIAYRRQLDELRIWEGSDFEIDDAVDKAIQSDNSRLPELLEKLLPLTPMIAQRHSYKTGTLRFFECQYSDDISKLKSVDKSADGLIVYWVSDLEPDCISRFTQDGKPLLVIKTNEIEKLESACREVIGLRHVSDNSTELRTDGVARREIRQRLHFSSNILERTIQDAFNLSKSANYWTLGKKGKAKTWKEFNSELSKVCDKVYDQSPVLWNELVNRRELTSQGSKARRMLIEAMLENEKEEKLGFEGHGPEVSAYYSVLESTGIHKKRGSVWSFGKPKGSGLDSAWLAIEDFCKSSEETPRSFSELQSVLSAKPYGIKNGIIPVLLASVLLAHSDDLCVYKDGSFIPVLGSEHFELLVRDPSRFSVKHFVAKGLREQVFREIEEIVAGDIKTQNSSHRNSTLLSVIKPLIRFHQKLPAYTQRTKKLSKKSIAVRQALINAKEPDQLLFEQLPLAVDMKPIVLGEKKDKSKAKELRSRLSESLKELQFAYENLISDCQAQMCEAFRTESHNLRAVITERCNDLVLWCRKTEFESFIHSAIDNEETDNSWLERLLMVISDKPVESWTDDDANLIGQRLFDFARKFSNFEAIQKSTNDSPGINFEPRRLCLTEPNGQELHKIVWIDKKKIEKVDSIVDEILEEKLDLNAELKEAVVSRLAEKLFSAVN